MNNVWGRLAHKQYMYNATEFDVIFDLSGYRLQGITKNTLLLHIKVAVQEAYYIIFPLVDNLKFSCADQCLAVNLFEVCSFHLEHCTWSKQRGDKFSQH